MIKKIPELYSRIGFLIDHPPKMDWMHKNKQYDLNCFADELKQLSAEKLFNKVIEVLTSGRVNLDYFCPLIGEFRDIDESTMDCNKSYIDVIFHSIIHFEYIESEEYKLAKSFHFYFKEKVVLSEQVERMPLMQKIYSIYPNLTATVSYPVFLNENIIYTNQLLVVYS